MTLMEGLILVAIIDGPVTLLAYFIYEAQIVQRVWERLWNK